MGVRSMAFVSALTRTDSTAQPWEGQTTHRKLARRRLMAKEKIRNASVFRPSFTVGTGVVLGIGRMARGQGEEDIWLDLSAGLTREGAESSGLGPTLRRD